MYMNFLKSSWPFILLAVLSFTIHFAFLSYPSQVVFDEVHFGKFVAAYSTGQYYFDIHPPLGKLMIAGFTKLAGVNPVFDFAQIGENLPAATLFALRFLPAFFGALFVLAFSWLAWLIGHSKQTALIAGFLILLDNGILVQSKFILVDIFMLCFEVLTLCFFFLWQRQKSFSAKWFSYLALTGVFAGLTVSVKWTGVAVIGIIGVILLAKIFSEKLALYLSLPAPSHSERSEESPADAGRHKVGDPSAYGLGMTKLGLFKEGLVGSIFLLILAFLIYLPPFYLHFQLLPNSGVGDAFMSQAFQQELKYGRDNIYQPLTFWQKFVELNKTMYTASAGLTAEHPFGSRWYNWPLNSKSVYYWNQETISGLPDWKAKIYFFGNPMLWPLAAFGVLFTLLAALIPKSRRWLFSVFYNWQRGRSKNLFSLRPSEPISNDVIVYILLLGYFINLLPFIFIKRVAFLYHYLPSLIYAVLILSLWLDKFWPKEKAIFSIVMGLIVLGFFLLAPLSYGWPLPQSLDQIEINFIGLFH